MSNVAVIREQAQATPFQLDNPVFDPSQFTNMYSVAEVMSQAKLVPEHLQNKPADCFLVVEQARRWNMSPFAVAQETYSIRGKLLFGGKLITAVINSRAPIVAPLRFDFDDGKGDAAKVTVSATFRGETEPRIYSITVGEARGVAGNSTLWKTDPRQQVCYFASRFWARRHCPEVVLGVWSEDEFAAPEPGPERARDITPRRSAQSRREAMQAADEVTTIEVCTIDGEVSWIMPGEIGAWINGQIADGAAHSDLAAHNADIAEQIMALAPGDELDDSVEDIGTPPKPTKRLMQIRDETGTVAVTTAGAALALKEYGVLKAKAQDKGKVAIANLDLLRAIRDSGEIRNGNLKRLDDEIAAAESTF